VSAHECSNVDPSWLTQAEVELMGSTIYLVRSRAGSYLRSEFFASNDVTAIPLAPRTRGGVPCTIHTAERCPPPSARVIVWRAPITSTCL
jgi:hypothetical protein